MNNAFVAVDFFIAVSHQSAHFVFVAHMLCIV